ncbi:MAG: hypothetical protein ABIW46_00870 [Acidimicrobiales bacterium]
MANEAIRRQVQRLVAESVFRRWPSSRESSRGSARCATSGREAADAYERNEFAENSIVDLTRPA